MKKFSFPNASITIHAITMHTLDGRTLSIFRYIDRTTVTGDRILSEWNKNRNIRIQCKEQDLCVAYRGTL